MSKATRAAIEDAIRAHVADETQNGDMLTGYAVLASAYPANIEEDGYATYWRIWPDSQPIHITLGLMEQYRSTYYAASNSEEIR